MKLIKYFTYITILYLISLNCYSAGQINSFSLTLINNTPTALIYTQAANTYPNTVFIMTPITLQPGEHAVLTSTSSNKNDLVGSIHFADKDGVDNVFNIINYRKFHTGQAIFTLNNSRYLSSIQTKKLNPASDPFALTYIDVTVTIQSR